MKLRTSRVTLVSVVAILLAGCGGAGHPAVALAPVIKWPAPSDPLTLTRRAGLVPELYEHLFYHVHAHLDVFLNGHPVRVPAGLGINIHDPGVHRFKTPIGTAYGGIRMCQKPCISPLHTHDATGVLHTETDTPTPNHLGQAFIEWGVRLTPSCVDGYCRPRTKIAVYVNGKPYTGNPNNILLANHAEIAVVIGSPPAQIPSRYKWSY